MDKEDQDLKLVQRVVDQLIEHFDTVQVLTTRHCGEEGTVSVSLGSGNWYARYGQVKNWVLKKDEETRKEVKLDE